MKKRIHQIDISPHSDFAGKTMTLTEGTTLMVMGNVETIKKCGVVPDYLWPTPLFCIRSHIFFTRALVFSK